LNFAELDLNGVFGHKILSNKKHTEINHSAVYARGSNLEASSYSRKRRCGLAVETRAAWLCLRGAVTADRPSAVCRRYDLHRIKSVLLPPPTTIRAWL